MLLGPAVDIYCTVCKELWSTCNPWPGRDKCYNCLAQQKADWIKGLKRDAEDFRALGMTYEELADLVSRRDILLHADELQLED